MAKTIELKSVPSTLSYYLRALTAGKSGQWPGEEKVLGRVLLRERKVDVHSLNAYCRVCGFPTGDQLPASYPFVLAAPLHMELLVSDIFPCRALGLVHIRNEITQYRPIGAGELLDIDCSLNGPRPVPKGVEFDLYTRVFAGEQLLWECVTVMLKRDPHRGSAGRSRVGGRRGGDFDPDTRVQWRIPGDIGRRYARVSGDSNPIHLSALTARLFGFRRAIAHGMWTKARCLAELQSLIPGGSFRVAVAFKSPIWLPSEVLFLYRAEGDFIQFAVKDSGGKKPHLTGVIEGR